MHPYPSTSENNLKLVVPTQIVGGVCSGEDCNIPSSCTPVNVHTTHQGNVVARWCDVCTTYPCITVGNTKRGTSQYSHYCSSTSTIYVCLGEHLYVGRA